MRLRLGGGLGGGEAYGKFPTIRIISAVFLRVLGYGGESGGYTPTLLDASVKLRHGKFALASGSGRGVRLGRRTCLMLWICPRRACRRGR